jgi:Spy/CpxP family protein refolding chaperone
MTDNSPFDAAAEAPLAPPSRTTRLLAVGVLVVVALAGVIGGVALDRAVLRPHQGDGRGMMGRGGERRQAPRRPSDMLGADLKLTPEQAVRIDTLIERQMRGFRDVRQSTQPAIDSLMAQTRRAMDSILTPGQRTLLDSARTRREAEFKKRFPNGGPPRGGPGDWGRGAMRRP